MKIGDIVTIMYPFDVYWWKVKGQIIDIDGDNCKVKKQNGELIYIHKGFIDVEAQ